MVQEDKNGERDLAATLSAQSQDPPADNPPGGEPPLEDPPEQELPVEEAPAKSACGILNSVR